MGRKKQIKDTNYERLFGTPERAAETVRRMVHCCYDFDCRGEWCPVYHMCSYDLTKKSALSYLKGRK